MNYHLREEESVPLTLETATRVLYDVGVGSRERLAVMMRLLASHPAEECWPVFLRFWSCCDLTGDHAAELVELLETWRSGAAMVDYLDDEASAFFQALPQQVVVYRGGNAGPWLTKGLAWTTDRETAREFARGHRGLYNRQPRIATGKVDKDDILAVFTDRGESEIIVAPRSVKTVKVVAAKQEIAV
jgi:hypothetical protein